MCFPLVWFDAVERTLDKKLLLELAGNTGKDWKRLATELDFSTAHIERFEHNYRDDLQQQAFQMFVAWKKMQINDGEARGKLTEALHKIGRADMAAKIKGNGKPYNLVSYIAM